MLLELLVADAFCTATTVQRKVPRQYALRCALFRKGGGVLTVLTCIILCVCTYLEEYIGMDRLLQLGAGGMPGMGQVSTIEIITDVFLDMFLIKAHHHLFSHLLE